MARVRCVDKTGKVVFEGEQDDLVSLDALENIDQPEFLKGSAAAIRKVARGEAEYTEILKTNPVFNQAVRLNFGLSPAASLSGSPSPSARSIGQRLFRQNILNIGNARGRANAAPIESLLQTDYTRYISKLSLVDDLYAQHRVKAGTTGKTLSRQDFLAQVDVAGASGVATGVKEVDAAVDIIRSNIREIGTRLRKIPEFEDIPDSFFNNYWPQQLNYMAIEQKPQEFLRVVEQKIAKDRMLAGQEPLSSDRLRKASLSYMNSVRNKGGTTLIDEFKLNLARPLNKRVLTWLPEELGEFGLFDASQTYMRYVYQITPQINFFEQFGTYKATEFIQAVKADYKSAIDAAIEKGDVKLKTKLEGQLARDIKHIEYGFAYQQNQFGFAALEEGAYRTAVHTVKTWNEARLLEGFVTGSLPDAVAPAIVHGIEIGLSSLVEGFTKSLSQWARGPLKEISRAELKVLTRAIEADRIRYFKSTMDINEARKAHNLTEYWTNRIGVGVAQLTGRPYFIDMINTIGSISASKHIQKIARKAQKDALTKADVAELSRIGLTAKQAKGIGDMLDKHGAKVEGYNFPNPEKWDDVDLKDAYIRALYDDVSLATMAPNIGDMPPWTKTGVGGIVAQLKGFMFGIHYKMVLPQLQRAGHLPTNFVSLSAYLASGILAYELRSLLSGRDTSDDTLSEKIFHGVNYSGILGLGTLALDVLGPNGSRYGTSSALFGPTVGLADDVGTTLRAPMDREIQKNELFAMRRLVPMADTLFARWVGSLFASAAE